MPKRTIYIKDNDLPLWEQAERLGAEDSVSAVLTAALQHYLVGQRALVATVWLRGSQAPFETRVQPASAGWLLGAPDGDALRPFRRALQSAGLFSDLARLPQASRSQQLWVWVPAEAIAGLWFVTDRGVDGFDYQQAAREAWAILVPHALSGETLTYGALGERLGGLHPFHQVPRVLDLLERWCLEHHLPDLTGLVVSQRTGLPGEDYWRQNGWADLSIANRVDRWRVALDAMKTTEWPPAPSL